MISRFVLAATEHLHKRIAKISDRVRQLEDALASLQAKHYNEPHPLLRDDLLTSNNVQDDDFAGSVDDPSGSNPPEVMDTFGMLFTSENGTLRYFGPTGGPEVSLFGGIPLYIRYKNFVTELINDGNKFDDFRILFPLTLLVAQAAIYSNFPDVQSVTGFFARFEEFVHVI